MDGPAGQTAVRRLCVAIDRFPDGRWHDSTQATNAIQRHVTTPIWLLGGWNGRFVAKRATSGTVALTIASLPTAGCLP